MATITEARGAVTGFEIAVPASIGNVGPGFDALSLALQLYLRARIVEVVDDGQGRLTCRFQGAPPGGENRVAQAFHALRARQARALPSIAVEVRSEIPVRAGLGSSAAAVVAGLQLFQRIHEPQTLDTLLRVAAGLEGHPDNAASALCGGLSACCQREDGTFTAWSWPWPDDIKCVVATPAMELQTEVARRVLPAYVARADAVFNLQHTLLLLHAIEARDRHALREALRDRWHQPYRQTLVPALDRLLTLEHPDLLGVCLSGSGPSVVALADRHFDEVEALLRETYAAVGLSCTVRCLSVHQKGCQ